MVFGGGSLPKKGIERFVGWTRESRHPRALIVAWASEVPEVTAGHLERALTQCGPLACDFSLAPPRTNGERREFLDLLGRTTAVFFSGGDQNRIASVIANSEIRESLRDRFRSGIPYAGTSAGTAIMSKQMLAGDRDPGALDTGAVWLREGLGLCDGVIFDQHFLKRQRQNRLFSAVFRHPDCVGIGVDEDTGLAIVDGRLASVVGPEKVMRIAKSGPRASLSVDLYEEGEEFDLFSGEIDASVAAS